MSSTVLMKWLWQTMMLPPSGISSGITFSSMDLRILEIVPEADFDVLSYIRRLPRARATWKQLAKELGSRGVKRDQLEAELQRLVNKGILIEHRSGHYVVASLNREVAVGRLSMHRDGYGFLMSAQPIEGLQGDIFIPPNSAEGAMHEYRVMVHISRIAGGKAERQIIRVLKRAHPTVVGAF